MVSTPVRRSLPLWTRLRLYITKRSFQNFPGYVGILYRLFLPIIQFIMAFSIGFAVAIDKLVEWLLGRVRDPGKASRQKGAALAAPGDAWAPVNHSDSAIQWMEVSDAKLLASIRNSLLEWPRMRWPDWYGIDRLCENNATHNYRIVPGIGGDPFMLRLHVGEIAQTVIKADHQIRNWLASTTVFANSPVANCLLPLPTKNGSNYLLVDFEVGPGIVAKVAQCFPYAHDVSHYWAPSEDQMLSFAKCFAELQTALQSMPRAIAPKFSVEDAEAYWWPADDLRKDLHEITGICEVADRKHPRKTAATLWLANRSMIFEWLDKCCSFWSTSTEPVLLLLHDVHPHNAFFIENDCVLIYDYQWIGNWRHGDVVAYSLHRFVREWVRASIERRDPAAIERMPSLASEFLEAYEVYGPPLPADVRHTLDLRIAGTCLFKLRHVMMSSLQVWPDWFDRPTEVLTSEVAKFVSFLKEASYFRHA